MTIVGGGLAGCEAAWQLSRRGVGVDLVEMRPVRATPVHQTADLAELVCSNSLRGNDLDQAAGLLKEEMRRLDSLVVRIADEVRVPAGSALAVDRGLFARRMTEAVSALPGVTLRREEVLRIPDDPLTIVATGPLTSEPLASSLLDFVGRAQLYFYDAVSPVVEADSIDFSKAFRASRYGKGGDDYVNCPLTEPEYRAFYAALTGAESASVHDFDKEHFFEGCLPVEVIGSRGPETLRFGPMKPVGLHDPRTGSRPFAVVQLRQDNLAASHYSVVGFQTQLKWSEQKRVFRLVPGLENAEFVRFGMIHRNTYVNAPSTLEPTFETRKRPGLFFAGQMSGVEGYVESAASGLVAGIGAARPSVRQRAHGLPGGHGPGRPRPLHREERPRELPAHEHRLRAASRAAGADQGQGPKAHGHGPSRPRKPRALSKAPRIRRSAGASRRDLRLAGRRARGRGQVPSPPGR